MLKAFFVRLILAVACLASLAGCGEGDSETRGAIQVSAVPSGLTAGLYLVEVQALYSNPDAASLEGFPITITATIRTPDGVLIDEKSEELSANSAGSVQYDLEIEQGAVDAVVTITASSGGLGDRARVVIPALPPITSSPASLSFGSDAAAGSTQSLFVSGGIGPYTATVDAAHAGDLTARVAGNEVIITKLNSSVATDPVKLATVTVSGANTAFTPLSVGVSYQ